MKTESRIIAATPVHSGVHPVTVQGLVRQAERGIQWLWEETTYIDMARAILVQRAMQLKATHILFVDADMQFPADGAYLLLRAGLPVVAANYRTRRMPHGFVTRSHNARVSSEDRKGVQKVDTIGFGFALIDLDIFEDMPQPWFRYGAFYEGEDIAFCQRCMDANIPVYIDHDVSQEVGHIGQKTYRVDTEGH